MTSCDPEHLNKQARMEGLVLHGAAHIFFENKLGELESHINIKFKKIESKLKKEMREIFQYQHNEVSKLKLDIKEIKEELTEIRQKEENLSYKGMSKISKLTKEVKTELNEIKKLKTDVNELKKEVIGIRQSEEDMSKLGMDTLSKLGEEFKTEMKQVKTDMRSVKKDIVSIKQAFKNKVDADNDNNSDAGDAGDAGEPEVRPRTPRSGRPIRGQDPGHVIILDQSESPEPDMRPRTPRSGGRRQRTSSCREAAKVPPTIVELLHSSEEEQAWVDSLP